jgi:ribosomal peptide maturation radical SAM protein 1
MWCCGNDGWRMMKLKLLNMPFALPAAPSLALTQLERVVRDRFAEKVSVEIVYANMDFALQLGDLSQYLIPQSSAGFMAGVGDWFFRQAAFPESPDNTDAYLARFFHDQTPGTLRIREFLLTRRAEASAFIERTMDAYHLLDADLVGCTALFAQTTASLAILRRLKALKPSIITVIGGACCEGSAGQELATQAEGVDFVFSGPGLVSFPRLVENILAGHDGRCQAINGVFTKRNRHAWRIPGRQDGPVDILGDDLDINTEIPLEYEGFLDRFEAAFAGQCLRPVLYFETSRGCLRAQHHPCSFCGLNGLNRHYRAMLPEVARRQIERLFRYHPRAMCYVAVDNLMPAAYVNEVFQALETPADAVIKYEVRPDLDDAGIATLCRAGVRVVQPGIESLSTRSLKLMRKGLTAFSNLAFLKRCARHPLEIEWNLLVFSPGETVETYAAYLRLIPLLAHLPPPTGAYPVMYARYSRYFEDPARFGLRLRPQDFYGMTYPFPPESVERLAFLFVDEHADTGTIDDWLDRLNGAVQLWRTRWFNTDGQEEARLCFAEEAGAPAIYDSRSGTEVTYRISGLCEELLAVLEMPTGPEDLKARFGNGPVLDHELAFLREKGFVFEEDGRLLSLVVRH